jgi:hypothetical protein
MTEMMRAARYLDSGVLDLISEPRWNMLLDSFDCAPGAVLSLAGPPLLYVVHPRTFVKGHMIKSMLDTLRQQICMQFRIVFDLAVTLAVSREHDVAIAVNNRCCCVMKTGAEA